VDRDTGKCWQSVIAPSGNRYLRDSRGKEGGFNIT
jgi:hypothetical protein